MSTDSEGYHGVSPSALGVLRWPLLAGLVAVLVAGSWLTACLVSADSASRLRGRKACPVWQVAH